MNNKVDPIKCRMINLHPKLFLKNVVNPKLMGFFYAFLQILFWIGDNCQQQNKQFQISTYQAGP